MLGSFELRTDDGVLADVPGDRLRGLLIALALEPGHAVPKATLVDRIWGERATQTNEAGRCAVLLPVLAALPQPLALLDVGASAAQGPPLRSPWRGKGWRPGSGTSAAQWSPKNLSR
jgi:Uncharacterized protein conserved in bacteria (DUF2332)